MRRTLLILLLFALSMAEAANAGSAEKPYVSELSSELESSGLVLLFHSSIPLGYYLAATAEQLSSAPTWSPDALLPPFSQQEALRAAHRQIGQANPDFDRFRLSMANLVRIPNQADYRDKWWYFLRFWGTSRIRRGREFLAVVLMNGEVLEPNFTKQEPSQEWRNEKRVSRGSLAGVGGKRTESTDTAPSDIEKRLSSIVIPEVGFRGARIYDIVEFFNACVTEFGSEAGRGEQTRLQVKLHESALIYPSLPYALSRSHPLLTFEGKNMSLLDALRQVAGFEQLKLHMGANAVTLYHPEH